MNANGSDNDARTEPVARPLSSIEVSRAAKAYFAELTGKECERVSGLARNEDGWAVMVEVVELERIPQTTDILATYCVTIDSRGELLGYERVRRYCRCQADEARSE